MDYLLTGPAIVRGTEAVVRALPASPELRDAITLAGYSAAFVLDPVGTCATATYRQFKKLTEEPPIMID